MASIVVNGDTSGAVTLSAPAVSGSTTLTLPTTSSTLATLAAQTFTGTQTMTTLTSPTATALTLQSAGTTAITVDTSQNVGIGCTPTYKFEVQNASGSTIGRFINTLTNGTSTVILDSPTGTGSQQVVFTQGGTGKYALGTNVGGASGSQLSFYNYVAGSNTLTLDSSGNVMVGTTSSAKGSSGTILSSGGPQENIRLNGTSPQTFVTFNLSGTTVGSISASGSLTSYNTSSDYRLKENIQSMQNALATISQLKPVTYKWKTDGTDGQGFIAHELQAVVPDCVTGEKDGLDEDGNPKYQGIDTSFLVATLTAAIQELKAELDTVKAELAALKG